MQVPVQFTFHGMDPSPALEADIREGAEKLEEFFDRLEVGDEVRFAEVEGAKGPTASTVHAIGKHHPGR